MIQTGEKKKKKVCEWPKLPCIMNEENLSTFTEKFPADASLSVNNQAACISLPRLRMRLIHGGVADTGEFSWQIRQV